MHDGQDSEMNLVTQTVWPWRDRQPAQEAVSASASKRRYWIQWLIMVTAALIIYHVFNHRVIGTIIGGLSVLLLSGIFFFDGVLRGFDRVGHWLARNIGAGLTWILLVPFFHVVFGIGHLGLKLRKKDPMRRLLDASASSYWTPHPKMPIEKRYHKQY